MCDVIDSSLFYDFVLYLRLLSKAFTFFPNVFLTSISKEFVEILQQIFSHNDGDDDDKAVIGKKRNE